MTTKAQLQAEVEALRHNLDQREAQITSLTERVAVQDAVIAQLRDKAARPAKHSTPRTAVAFPRPIYEFNPDIAGDYDRAKALAIANRGTTVRMRSSS